MKTTLRYVSLPVLAASYRQVEKQLRHLQGLTPITAANVILEHQREAKAPFRVRLRLEVPGPGPHPKATRHDRDVAVLLHDPALHADATENTLGAALLKATHEVEHQIEAHELRHQAPGRSQYKLGGRKAIRWIHAQPTCRV